MTCNGVPVPLRPTGTPGDVRRRRALPGLAAAVGAAPDDRRSTRRWSSTWSTVERPVARRLHVPRRPPRRPGLRHVPGQRQRGRGPPGQPVLDRRPHAGPGRRRPGPWLRGLADGTVGPWPAPVPVARSDLRRHADRFGRTAAAAASTDAAADPMTIDRTARPRSPTYRPLDGRATTRCSTADGRAAPALGPRRRSVSTSWASTSCRPPRARRAACSTTTASPTTSTARPGAAPASAAGASTRCRWCSPATSGPASSAASSSGPSCSTSSSPTSTGPASCAPRAAPARAGARPPRLPAAVRPDPPARRATSCSPPRSTSAATATGEPWVLADRTQAPSGAGYALENRVVVSRVFPEPVPRRRRSTGWRRSSATLRAALAGRGPAGRRRAPHRACSRPGPCSETAFEHAFLASYLGYPLVEGADLPCATGGCGCARSAGSSRVDVILRRVDALVLRPARAAPRLAARRARPGRGLPRRARCRWSTRSGSGVLENPGLLPFLPRAGRAPARPAAADCRRCPPGGAATTTTLGHVLADLDELVIKPIARELGVAARSSAGELDRRRASTSCAAASRPSPMRWVGQEPRRAGVGARR